MTTAIIGATGRIGSAVAQRLLAADQPVRALVRDPDKAPRLQSRDFSSSYACPC